MRTYSISVPIDGGNWMQLCSCRTAAAAAEIIRVLLARGVSGPREIRIEPIGYDEEVPVVSTQMDPAV